jgi:membrane-associated phospholipid phosphatase
MRNYISLILVLLFGFYSLSPIQAGDDIDILCADNDPLLSECIQSTYFTSSDTSIQNAHNQVNDDQSIFIPLPYTRTDSVNFLRTLGVVGILMVFDQQIMDVVQDHTNDTTSSMADVGDYLGGRSGIPPIILGSLAAGLIFRNDNLRRTALSAVGNLVLTGAIVEVLKALTHRHRPRQGDGPYTFDGAGWSSDNTSFPSGHSVAAWSIATIFASNYRETRWVPIVAYSFAALVSWSRVHDNAHWASDVVLSAGIAYFTGKLFRRRSNDDIRYSGGLTISPAAIQDSVGVNIFWTPRNCELRVNNVCISETDNSYLFN